MRPELDGTEVIDHLGIKPGPLVGTAMKFLLDLRLDEGILGREAILKRLDAWWAANDPSIPPTTN